MIADVVAGLAMLLRLANLTTRFLPNQQPQPSSPVWRYHTWSLLTGALLANAIPHFVHGVSGMPFPAPFSSFLGAGAPTAVANVLWGGLNLAIGLDLLRTCGAAPSPKLSRALTAAGFLAMSIFLAIVFSRLHG